MESSLIPKKVKTLAATAAGGFVLGSAFLVAGGNLFRIPDGDGPPSPVIKAPPLAMVPTGNTTHPLAREGEQIVKAIPLTALTPAELLARGIVIEPAAQRTTAVPPQTPPTKVVTPAVVKQPTAQPKLVSLHRSLMEPDVHQAPLSYYFTKRTWMEEMPAVYQAVLWGDTDVVSFMLSQGMDPNARTLSGDTPLCAAVRSNQESMVDLLLLYGADPNLPGREGQAPLALASLKRSPEILRHLVRNGADPNEPFATPVDQSILEEVTIRDLRYFLANDRGVTPLMACASRGDVEGAVELLRHGARTDKYTRKEKRYALNFAATQKYLFLMRVLLGRSPDAEPNLLVTVDLSQQKAWITKDGKVINSTKVSSGRDGYETPAGRYVVTDKHRSHTSTLYHVEMPWFMRLNCSAIGLHSGHVTGRPASHGCVRLPWDKAKEFFGIVQVGDEVEIVH